ncbi:hypothetical protein NEOLEDRAFT_1077044 [Neolentinus lepideus HHB14362 ss-1]|uniref:Uncharacterized protein n=1 Tax=Neolentinus lepideus HHB14362 ss-1 TaxID=1314782 RepID=A0A165NNB2_9AGAM|nr:hypothetical protein NEOLEDRAFT_1077044 [Neolentinus lepideus HHB14362 ss-1]
MEIGAPMAAAYILGNPDHYTSHRFQPVYWKSYVSEVLKSYDAVNANERIDLDHTEKLVLQKTKRGYSGYTPIMDYIYRSDIYKDVNLYDWIRLSRRSALPKEKIFKDTDDSNEDESETEHMTDIDTDINLAESDLENDTRVENEADQAETPKKKKTIDIRKLTFTKGHPQYGTHYTTIVKEEFGVVPNFTGGALPRSDSGDREFYCTTMLTLFKPWRTGLDLKDNQLTWDDAFHQHGFSNRQLQLMTFFNICYECYDA